MLPGCEERGSFCLRNVAFYKVAWGTRLRVRKGFSFTQVLPGCCHVAQAPSSLWWRTAHWPRVCPHLPRFPLFLSTLKQIWTSSHHQATCSLLLSSKHRTVRFRIGKCCLAWRSSSFALKGHVSAGVCPGFLYATQSCLSHLEKLPLSLFSFHHQKNGISIIFVILEAISESTRGFLLQNFNTTGA